MDLKEVARAILLQAVANWYREQVPDATEEEADKFAELLLRLWK